ncbi:MAG: cyclic nucleotide-binding domain-containing protein [Actinomycetia bacterium]|nr:cyclic nucleotide-binding domain-containing protein [Actinomycetes bacterium]
MTTTATPSVWQAVATALDPRQRSPRLRTGVVVSAPERGRDGVTFAVVKSPIPGNYLRLTHRELEIVELMDGDRTVRDLAVEHFLRHRSFALNRIHRLAELLQRHEFLVEPPVDTYRLVHERLLARTRRGRVDRVLTVLTGTELALRRCDPLVDALYRRLGRFLLTPIVLAVLAVLAAAGMAAFFSGATIGRLRLAWLIENGPPAIVAVVAFLVVLIFLHELAHALVTRHFGRSVSHGGFTFYFGFPVFFVDTTDIWLEPRSRRIMVSAAGVLADLVVGGVAALLAVILPGPAAVLLGALAAIAYIGVAVNLIPLLALDGYYVLVDVLRMPMLRSRALRFVRTELPGRMRRRQRLTPEEQILACYGLLAGPFAVLIVWYSVGRLVGQVAEVGRVSVAGAVVLAVVLGVLIGLPALNRLVRQLTGLVLLARRQAGALVAASTAARLRRRVVLLGGVGILAELPLAQLRHVAAAMRERRIGRGVAVVREGDTGDRFFLISSGRAEVTVAGAAEPRAVRGPGDHFGELALLSRSPRSATVTALTDLTTFEMTAADFDVLVGPDWDARRRIERAAGLREALAAVDLFAGLRPTEVDLLARRMQSENVTPGDSIIVEGDPGERFYLVVDGEVEVSTAAAGVLRREGRGYHFGEIALLLDVPRTATVRACGPVRLAGLSKADFDDLLRRFLQLDRSIEDIGRQRLRATAHAGPDTSEVR